MTLDPTKWREIPSKPCYYEYIGPTREPDMEKIKGWIREVVTGSRNVTSIKRALLECDVVDPRAEL